jgi:type VI secretion system secreted protein VgrG
MANFKAAINFLLENEGGYSNNPSDPGKATNFGLSTKYLESNHLMQFDKNGDGKISPEDIKAIKRQDAIATYKSHWWDRYGYDRIDNDLIATKLFDMAVNMGQVQAVELMQKSLNRQCNSNKPPLLLDGNMGKNTIEAMNTVRDKAKLLLDFRNFSMQYYQKLIEKNPRLSVFLNGWYNRVYK